MSAIDRFDFIKIKLNFYFHTSLKAFIKPFEAPQRNVEIKI